MITTIHQTSKTKNLTKFQEKCASIAQQLHVNSEYKLWDDNDLLSIIEVEFPELAKIWGDIEGIQRADLGRYAVLFAEGGLYVDTDVVFNKNFFSYMELNNDTVLLAPSVKIFPWSSSTMTNYIIYAPRVKMEFFRELVNEGTRRIKKTSNKNFLEYIPYTTGRVLINDIASRHNVNMISDEKVKNKFCSFTDTRESMCYHEGSTIRNEEDGSWRNTTTMNIVNAECKLREKAVIRGDICQFPILLTVLILLFGIISYFVLKRITRG